MDDEAAKAFTILFNKIEAQRAASAAVTAAIVKHLHRSQALDAEELLEHLYLLQSNLPGLAPDTPADEKSLGTEGLRAVGGIIQAIERSLQADG